MKEVSGINVKIDTIAEKKKVADVPALVKKAELTISNQAELDKATDVLKDIKSRYKELDTQRKAITKPLDEAKKAVMDLFNQPLELLKRAEDKIKGLIGSYTTEQERKAREEQARLQKLADQEAEKEKKKIDARIERAKENGKLDKVEELEAQKETIIPIDVPVIAPSIDTPKGVSFREIWSAEIVDEKQIPREYLIPNMQALNKIASATKGTITIPGVKFKMEKSVVTRT